MPSLIERKRQYTRDMIVGAAEDLFSRHGYHNTQVMDIVKAVGMSAGTFYNYFKDKRDLFAQIAHQNLYELRRRIKKLREPVNIWDHGDRVEKLNASYGAYFDYISSHRQQFLMILRGSFGVDEEMDITMARMQQADEAANVYGGCGPRLNEPKDPSEWLGKENGPKAKLENEKEPGQTIAYEELIKQWTK